jgi:hypothetical protein
MNGVDAAAAYAALHAPSADTLRRSLPEVGDGLQGQLHELSARPSAERCEQAARNLEGARLTVLRLREALLREGTGDVECAR